MEEISRIRQPMVAGLFYSGDKTVLERELAVYLENAEDRGIEGEILALVAPHAGYVYSAGVAALAYRQIMDREIDIVAVISPSHREYFTEVSIYNGYAYATPLGTIEVNRELARQLSETNQQLILSDKGHRLEEHALEVQLPLLQKTLDRFEILPIVIGEQSHDNIETLSSGLATVLRDRKALIVASTDLSHFYSADKAHKLDSVVVENIKNFDEEQLFADLNSGQCEMCGGGPVIAAMKASKLLGANKSQFLTYRHSGDISGDNDEVVGYLSAVFYRQ